jgi:hypothetical protein
MKFKYGSLFLVLILYGNIAIAATLDGEQKSEVLLRTPMLTTTAPGLREDLETWVRYTDRVPLCSDTYTCEIMRERRNNDSREGREPRKICTYCIEREKENKFAKNLLEQLKANSGKLSIDYESGQLIERLQSQVSWIKEDEQKAKEQNAARVARQVEEERKAAEERARIEKQQIEAEKKKREEAAAAASNPSGGSIDSSDFWKQSRDAIEATWRRDADRAWAAINMTAEARLGTQYQ